MADRKNLPEPQPLRTESQKKSLNIYRKKFALPDAADLVAPVRASLHGTDDTEFEVGETDD